VQAGKKTCWPKRYYPAKHIASSRCAMTKTSISRARKGDLRALEEIYRSPELKTSLREARWFVRCYFDYHHILLAKVDGKVRGACFWRIEGEEYSGLGWVENLWVEQADRRRGLGELLLRRTIEEMGDHYARRGVRLRRIMLTTQAERTSARRLYRRAGFELRARLGDLYGPRAKDLVYVLEVGR